MLFQRIVSVTAKCTINVIDCIQEVFITSVFSPGLSCECFVGIRVREILVPERERGGGGGVVEGGSNNRIICSSLPMDRTGGGACKLFTSVVSGPLHESRVKPP